MAYGCWPEFKPKEAIVRQFTPLLLLLCLPLLCGCEALEAGHAAPAGPALWSAADAQQALDDLRAIREQTRLLAKIEQQTAAANAAIATLNDRQAELIDQLRLSSDSTTNAVAKVSTGLTDLQDDLEGVEQRLDNPLFPPAPPQPSSPPPLAISHSPSASSTPLCVTIDGIDYDLPQLVADWYESPWTWVGSQDANGLRKHLAEHGVTNIDGLSFATLKKLHAALHEKEIAANDTRRVVGATGDLQLFGDVQPKHNPPDLAVTPPDGNSPVIPETCPNGQCPLVRSRTVQVTRTEPAGASTVTRSRSVSCPGGVCPAPGVSYRQTYYRSAPRARVRWFR
jgi:hypothetical protein